MSEFLQRARALAPAISEAAADGDAARQMPEALVQSMASAGLMGLVLPTELGGPELAPVDLVSVLEVLGEADGAAGWCAMIASTTAVNAAWLPQQTAAAIWSTPDIITGGVFAPRGRAVLDGDQLRLTGRWAWGSGSAYCDWLSLGALVVGGDGKPVMLPSGRPSTRLCWVRAGDVERIDTWHTLGIRASGSVDLAVTDVTVPLSHTVSLTDDRPRIDRPLYAFPVFCLLALGIAGVCLGIARGAVNDVMELAGSKVATGASKPLALRAATQEKVAEAEATLRAARALVMAEAASAWAQASSGQGLSLADRAGLRIAATHAARSAAAVVRVMHDLAGGTSVYTSFPLERRFRDIHVATQHIMVAPGTWEQAGRALLGVDGDFATL